MDGLCDTCKYWERRKWAGKPESIGYCLRDEWPDTPIYAEDPSSIITRQDFGCTEWSAPYEPRTKSQQQAD